MARAADSGATTTSATMLRPTPEPSLAAVQPPGGTLQFGFPEARAWWDPEPVAKPLPDEGAVAEEQPLTLLSGAHVTYIRTDSTDPRTGLPVKDFFVRTASGDLLSADLVDPAQWPLFGSEDLTSRDDTVVVVEGMAPALALRSKQVVAVGTLTGATQTPSSVALEPLRKRHVVLWPDNDVVGVTHMARIAQALQPIARSVRLARWVGGPHHGDALDLIDSGADRSTIKDLVDAARAWDPGTLMTASRAPQLRPEPSPLFLRSARKLDVERGRWMR